MWSLYSFSAVGNNGPKRKSHNRVGTRLEVLRDRMLLGLGPGSHMRFVVRVRGTQFGYDCVLY